MHKITVLFDDEVILEKEVGDDLSPATNCGKKVFDGFDANRNILEYEGIVGDIQRWFYNSKDVVKSAWCATSLCYFADRAGCLDRIGGKHENVFDMLRACEACAKEGKGKFYSREHLPDKIPQYAICFFLWSGNLMAQSSSKHVCMAEYASSGSTIYCIGGNQSDKICTKEYARDKLYAIYLLDS